MIRRDFMLDEHRYRNGWFCELVSKKRGLKNTRDYTLYNNDLPISHLNSSDEISFTFHIQICSEYIITKLEITRKFDFLRRRFSQICSYQENFSYTFFYFVAPIIRHMLISNTFEFFE